MSWFVRVGVAWVANVLALLISEAVDTVTTALPRRAFDPVNLSTPDGPDACAGYLAPRGPDGARTASCRSRSEHLDRQCNSGHDERGDERPTGDPQSEAPSDCAGEVDLPGRRRRMRHGIVELGLRVEAVSM